MDEATGKASVIDVLRIVFKRDSSCANATFRRVFETDDSVKSPKSRMVYTRITDAVTQLP